jgi:hypothetical protein
MSRRQRQIDELRCLCGTGAVGRAVDLAHQHFADFGRDDDVIRMLDDLIEAAGVPEELRRRYADLTARGDRSSATGGG